MVLQLLASAIRLLPPPACATFGGGYVWAVTRTDGCYRSRRVVAIARVLGLTESVSFNFTKIEYTYSSQ